MEGLGIVNLHKFIDFFVIARIRQLTKFLNQTLHSLTPLAPDMLGRGGKSTIQVG